MNLEEIDSQFVKAIEGKLSYDDTWHFMMDHFDNLLKVAKAAKYMVDRRDLHYLHAEIKDPLMENVNLKLKALEKP